MKLTPEKIIGQWLSHFKQFQNCFHSKVARFLPLIFLLIWDKTDKLIYIYCWLLFLLMLTFFFSRRGFLKDTTVHKRCFQPFGRTLTCLKMTTWDTLSNKKYVPKNVTTRLRITDLCWWKFMEVNLGVNPTKLGFYSFSDSCS